MGNERKVVVGGTFEYLHAGHIKLLNTAFSLGEEIVIGVTSDEMARKMRRRRVKSFDERVEQLKQLVDTFSRGKRYRIIEINDPYGPTINEKDLDIIVVSVETFPNALRINNERRRRAMKPLVIVVIPLVETNYGYKISSSLIYTSTLDEWGRTQ